MDIIREIQGKNWKDSDKLIVAIDLSVPNAYESRDREGNPYGISNDLAHALAKYMGKPLYIRDVAWMSMFQGVQSGIYDIGIATITVTPELESIVDFSIPYCYGFMDLIFKRDFYLNDLQYICSVTEIFNRPEIRITVRNNGFAQGIVKKNFPKSEAMVVDTDNWKNVFNYLLEDRTDAVLHYPAATDRKLREYPGQFIVDRSLGPQPIAMAISKSADKEFRNIVNNFISQFVKNGDMVELALRHSPSCQAKHICTIKEEWEKQGKFAGWLI